VPWHAVATSLGRPPVPSYSSYALNNYFRFEPERPIECGNLGLIQNFLGGIDEEWFILIHVGRAGEYPYDLPAEFFRRVAAPRARNQLTSIAGTTEIADNTLTFIELAGQLPSGRL
jgi:hypothetical protein